MRILDIHIGCFGGIQNMKLSFKDGFQIIYGENGYGKSTVMAFIHLMLYGKNSKSRDLNQNLRKKYTPYNGNKMNGSMRWEINGHSIRIDREFGKTQANDVFYVFNETVGTELLIPAGMEIGEYLLDMNEKIFDKVIFGGSPDGDMGTGAEEIMSELVNMGAAGDKEISVADILEDLNTGMEQLKSKRGTSGSIPRISQEISRMNEEKAALEQRKKELEQIRRSDISMADKEKALLVNLIGRLEDERYLVQGQGKKMAKRGKTAENRGNRGLRIIFAVACFVFGMLLIGIGKGILGDTGYGYVAAFLLFLVGTGFLAASGRKQYLSENEEDSGGYSEKINELLDDLGYNGYSSEDLKARLWELEHTEDEDLSGMIGRICQEMEDCQIQLKQLRKKREELTEEYEAYKIALSVMQECATELRSTVSRPLNDMAGEIFFRLTDGYYDGFMADGQYQIRVREQKDALYREWKNLSTGTANQAYLSLRIAVNEIFSEQENMPLLLDDVLSNYDEKRAERAIQVLKERGGQVILFTCHKNLLQIWMH